MNNRSHLQRQLYIMFLASFCLIGAGCQSPDTAVATYVSKDLRPEQDLAPLFHDVQMQGVFPDSKTFVDCKPLAAPNEILEYYRQSSKEGTLDLTAFVNQYFEIPVDAPPVNVESGKPMVEHLMALWPSLTRTPDTSSHTGSLLPLPYPYVVPGGRFREVYYWDSYFTMLGLLKSDQDSLVLNMIRNFAYLIDQQGFIPNGNRTYYLGRSQPPFFGSMVMLWAVNQKDLGAAIPFLPQMIKEHEFWMEGKDQLNEDKSAFKRVIRLPDGTILNRYWDDFAAPRPESYREDYQLAQSFPENQRERIYRDLRAGAESGWDYSSRWFSDGVTLDSIVTTQIAPVDLNSLLYFLESSIAELSRHAGNVSQADYFEEQSKLRANAIKTHFWDPVMGYFSDLNLQTGQTTLQFSAAGMTPMFFNIASQEQGLKATKFLKENLLYPGGIVSTTVDTGQQWDFPNGWAPQQWIGIVGLRNYHQQELAADIASRWLGITEKVYNNTGKMMEKYNVVDLTLAAGGGEYPTQDGFGWTNGVTLALQP